MTADRRRDDVLVRARVPVALPAGYLCACRQPTGHPGANGCSLEPRLVNDESLGWTLKQGAVCVRDSHEQRLHGRLQLSHCRLKLCTVVLAQVPSRPDSDS